MRSLLTLLRPVHFILLAINVLMLMGFGSQFVGRENYEFLIYVAVIVVLLSIVAITYPSIRYSIATLAGLTIWSGLHLAGGGVPVADGRLYDTILWPISSQLPIFRYDQMVHIVGFGSCTLLSFDLLKSSLVATPDNRIALGIVVVMSGAGWGALNEILEFLVTLVVPQSGVGGYQNTALDLCSNLVGALLVMPWIQWQISRTADAPIQTPASVAR